MTRQGIADTVSRAAKRLRFIYETAPLQARLFLVLGSIFGIIFVLVNPPMQTADEPQHYLRAYTLTDLNFSPDSTVNNRFGFLVPGDVAGMVDDNSKGVAPVKRANTAMIKKYFHKQNSGQTSMVYFENTAVYPPWAYVPQATGISLGRVLHLPLMFGFYAGRLLNLTLWLALVFLAISLIPFARWLMLVLALLPMTIYQSASLSADATLNGLIFLLIAGFFYLMNSKYISRKNMAFTAMGLALVGAVKPAYTFLILPFLFLPKSRFKNPREYYRCIALLVAAVAIVSLAWFVIVSPISNHIHDVLRPGEHIVPSEQVKYMAHNPVHFAGAVIHTLVFQNFSFLLNGALGIFGWLDIPLPGYAYLLLTTLIVLAVLKDGETVFKPFALRQLRWVLAATAFLVTLLMAATFYVGYSVVGADTIEGLQGRYFLPVLLVGLPALMSPGFRLKVSDKHFTLLVVGILIVAVMASVFSILDANYLRILYGKS